MSRIRAGIPQEGNQNRPATETRLYIKLVCQNLITGKGTTNSILTTCRIYEEVKDGFDSSARLYCF